MTVLAKPDIRRLIQEKPPLIEGYLDLEAQLQPNGFDISIRDIARLETPGTIARENSQRAISALAPLEFDGGGFITLPPGPYLITHNEIVHLPNNVMALGRPRSSLLRCGVTVNTAVWDAGYSGRSQSLLVVYNQNGFKLQKDARVMQLVFFYLTGTTEGYKGKYQGENI
ncbi:MAG TPA: deoxyuridine 5'-triphosphate nucleotidohydrolase [Dehalococcoidales bacterium]|nr:deoxyuridine 5'-triphosphate nucleotidohydrolase [Dehalococcoidales bacterium]